MKPVLRFDMRSLIADARRRLNSRVGGVSISLPFVSFNLEPKDLERRMAEEILIRLADRRVLSSTECCDNCIDNAITSLQEIRQVLVDKQVQLAPASDGGLSLLVGFMLEAIRQYLTFHESLSGAKPRILDPSGRPTHYEPRDAYFEGLNRLRAHLYACLSQVRQMAGKEDSQTALNAHQWRPELYEGGEENHEGA